jgi:hypothetical protein
VAIKVVIDTNILVYVYGASEGEKEIMKGSGLWVNTGGRAWDIVLSMQS